MAMKILGLNGLPLPDPSKPILDMEIASTRDGMDITRGYIGPILPPSDDLLWNKSAGDLDLYERVLDDAQVQALLQQRRLAVISREFEVIPGGPGKAEQKAAEALKYNLDNFHPADDEVGNASWDHATGSMHYGIFFGRAHCELIWTKDGKDIVMERLKVKNPRRFKFDAHMKLRLITFDNPLGIPLGQYPRKFWSFCTGSFHDDEPYGMGLAHWLYWLTLFKRQGLKFFLIYLEKFGMPTPHGQFPPGATQTDIKKLLATLKAIMTDSGIATPQGMDIKMLEAARSGSADYIGLQNLMDGYIAKLILGQMMTSEAVGGQYKADVQDSVKRELVKADADLICNSFNAGPARWFTYFNYGDNVRSPKVFRRIQDEPDLKPVAVRDKTIFDMGYRPTLKYITDTYGGEWVDTQAAQAPTEDGTAPAAGLIGLNGAQIASLVQVIQQTADQGLPPDSAEAIIRAAFPSLPDEMVRKLLDPAKNFKLNPEIDPQKATPPFAGGDDDAISLAEGEAGDLAEEYTQELGPAASQLLKGLVAPARKLVATASSLQTIRDGLYDLYSELPSADFGELLARVLVAAELAGRVDVLDEDD